MIAATAAALVYLPSLANELVWDDRLDILANPRVHNPGDASHYFGHLHGIYYRPLVFLTFAIDYAIWGERAWGYHLTNLVLHALNAFLVVVAVSQASTSAFDNRPAAADFRVVALLAGLLFALHPLQSDAVAYVSGRTDVLMTTGALIAWCGVRSQSSAWVRSVAAAAGTAVAILSKESGFAVVPLLAWWAYRHERTISARVSIAGSSLLIGVALLALRLGLSSSPVPSSVSFTGLVAVGRAFWTYVAVLIWPVDLQIDRLTASAGSSLGNLAAGVLAIVAALVALWGVTRRSSNAEWVVWSVAFYLPVANAVPLYPSIATHWLFTPEHNLYAPCAGLAAVVAGAIALRRLSLAVLTFVAASFIALVIVTIDRQRDWHDETRLFRSAVAVGSQSPRVWYNHGNSLARSAEWSAAADAYRTALRLSPHDVDSWSNLGVALQNQGNIDAAIDAYAKAATLAPPSAQLLENLGTAQLRRGDVVAARAYFMRALAIEPTRDVARRAVAAIDQATR